MEFVDAVKLVQTIKNDYSWFDTSYNMNIYRGCDQGCIYCDSRSSCYQVENFDTIKAKKDAPIKVEYELSNKRRKGIIGLGSMSDPYNQYEKELEYTRKSLIAINKYCFGLFVITKSDLVLRDIDIFKEINEHSVCNIALTITTGSDLLQGRIERNSSSTKERFAAIKTLSNNNIFAGVLMMPILPFINDTIENIKEIVELAHLNNAKYIFPSFGVTLRDNQREYFFEKIGKELTEKYKKVYGKKYMCISLNHKELRKYFEELCDKYGILYKMSDIIEESKKYINNIQMSLF